METGYSPVAARRHRDGGAVDVPSEVSAEGPKIFDEHRGGAAASRAGFVGRVTFPPATSASARVHHLILNKLA
eukprot:30957-Pelagococcus_subviridis.AAC.21